MIFRFINLILILIILHGRPTILELYNCDISRNSKFSEGNLGQQAAFPWLGVLRVHLHQGSTFKVALTGLVLVKDKYCIANADDIAKIPRSVLKDDSKAMFIPKDNEPWFSKVKDIMTHPEYEFSTMQTIALVELETNEMEEFPLHPICWPTPNYNTGNQLYTIGFTDEKKLLEKVIYKMQYVSRQPCDEFYTRVGTQNMDKRQSPKHYVCGFALNNKKHCVWDNGMVLASNSSGYWILVGLSLHGPGCAAPARFFDFNYFQAWIESATSREEIPDDARRFEDSRKQDKGDFDEVPAHSLLRNNVTVPSSQTMFYDKYGEEFFRIDRIEKNAISINFYTTYEKQKGDCVAFKSLIYREEMKIEAKSRRLGLARYKISIYDLYHEDYTCVILRVENHGRSPAYLWYNVTFEFGVDSFLDTPREIIRPHTIQKIATTTKAPGKWVPPGNLEPIFITDSDYVRNISNVNLYISFTYSRSAVLAYEVYGKKKFVPVNTTMKKNSSLRFGNDDEVMSDEMVDFKEIFGDNSLNKIVVNDTDNENEEDKEIITYLNCSTKLNWKLTIFLYIIFVLFA